MIDIDDFKETFTPVLYILSMIIVFGMLTLEVAGFGIFRDPALQTVWYINLGLFFLSYLALGFQAREGEVSEGWETSLKLEPPTRHKAVTHVTTKHSKPSEPLVPKVPIMAAPATLEAREGLEQKHALEKPMEAPTLDKATKAQLDKPTKEALDRLKEVLGLTEGAIAYKHGAVYSVQYDRLTKRHKWQRLGSWSELRQKLEAPQNPS